MAHLAFPPSRQRLLDGDADVTQIRRYPRRVDADTRKGHCDRTWITLRAFAHRELHGDGAVTVTAAPHALPEFRGQPCGQRVTRSAKGLCAGVPDVQVDADRHTGHDDALIAVACTEVDGSRCR